MGQNNESARLKISRTIVAAHPGSEKGASDRHPFIEITGREGSKTVFRKRINSLEDVTDAEVQKLLGIARRLPAVAFDALFDPDTIELMLNPDGKMWQEKLGGGMTHICNMCESESDEFIRKIAGYLKQVVTRDSPILEGVLPLDDSRFAGQIQPVVPHPTFAIRKRAVKVFTLDGGVIYIGSQSKFVPYVVEVDKLGQAAAIGRADRASAVDERVVHATVAAFVHDLRMVSFDRNVQNDAIWRVFALLQSGDPATNKITEFMKDPNTSPTQRAAENSVGVEISSVLRQTEETWEINWIERVWNRQGVRMEQSRMRGLATVYFVPPTTATTEEEIRRNPLGMYVRDFTWSRVIE